LGDVDSDGVPDGSDCASGDGQAWAVPGEVTGLLLSHVGGPVGTTTLDWTAPASLGGVSVVYDTVASSQAGDFSGGACVESNDGADTTAIDGTVLAGSEVLYFVVRAGNACSEGISGADSFGTPRIVVACP
jgi:hypothetical protein